MIIVGTTLMARKLELGNIGATKIPLGQASSAAVPLVLERNPSIYIFGRAKFSEEVNHLHALQVIHDDHKRAVAMVHSVISSYERPAIPPEDVIRETFNGEA